MVNYRDAEWIDKFITETLTNDDYAKMAKSFMATSNIDKLILEMAVSKLGYKKTTRGGFVYENEKGEIEDDESLQKLHDNIGDNSNFKQRVIKQLKILFDENSQLKGLNLTTKNEL